MIANHILLALLIVNVNKPKTTNTLKVITKQNKIIAKIWGDGCIEKISYRLMYYVVISSVEDGSLLYNTVTCELIHLDKKEMEHLSKLPCIYEGWMDELILKHFLVPTDYDERKQVDNIRKIIKCGDIFKTQNSYLILPTTACNARCYYCFEEGMKCESMTDETADIIIRMVEGNNNGKKQTLHWFGGEPLLGLHQIDRICSALNKRKVPYESRITTNGYLFDKDLIDHAINDWNLVYAHITIDGREETYNKIKAYINPSENPYQKVMNNIGYLLDAGIETQIRLNVSKDNFEDIDCLVDEIDKRFPLRDNLSVYSRLIIENYGSKPLNYSNEDIEELYNKKLILDKKILRHKKIMSSYLPQFKTNLCMADSDNNIIISPKGIISKCDFNMQDTVVGNINEGITDYKTLERIKEVVLLPKCSTCPLYPTCINLKACQSIMNFEIAHNCDGAIYDYKIYGAQYLMNRLYEQYKEEKKGTIACG